MMMMTMNTNSTYHTSPKAPSPIFSIFSILSAESFISANDSDLPLCEGDEDDSGEEEGKGLPLLRLFLSSFFRRENCGIFW